MSSLLPSLGKTLGAVYIGATLSSILLGVTALQAVIYYKKFPNDTWYYRYSVAALWILDVLHVALNTHAIYFYLIDSFGNYLSLDRVVWSFKALSFLQILINVIIVVGVQALYAVRLWKSSSVISPRDSTKQMASPLVGHHFHRFVPWFVSYENMTVMTYDAYTLSHVSRLPSISYFMHSDSYQKTVEGTFATTTSVDFIISGAMFYYLHRSTTITKFKSTITLILSLMRVVVISGLATRSLTKPKYLFALGPDYGTVEASPLITLGSSVSMYINSLLAMLNAREKNIKGSESHGTPQVLRLASENYSDIGIMESSIGMSLSETPGVTALDKI
ncbi:hypothetical protein DFS33DRAFT_1277034 [Desarmillaria ectypa]|nr:hypothetical protein DFS33DRAFT_1277034 [Desarmillaria ectypa]